jgi:hypothetical protein
MEHLSGKVRFHADIEGEKVRSVNLRPNASVEIYRLLFAMPWRRRGSNSLLHFPPGALDR